MSRQALLGNTLLTKDGSKISIDKLDDIDVVMLYFSAHWCGPCRATTPKLIEWYNKLKQNGKSVEIVFISSDKDQSAFDDYYSEMPWLALPFEDRDQKNLLSKKLKVSGIPTLAFVNKQGEVYEKNGRNLIDSDPEDFPFLPPTIAEALGTTFIRNDGMEVNLSDLKDKYIALYFSADWCPPCKAFTVPVLKPCYENIRNEASKSWEIIFVSGDQTKEKFDEYFGEQPWLAIPFDDKKRIENLNSVFEVSGIPCLIQLDLERKVLNKALRAAVSSDPYGKEFPWVPKPVNSLSEGVGEINELPVLLLLIEKENSTTQDQFKQIIAEIGEKHAALQKTGKVDEMSFLFATEKDLAISQKVRELTEIKDAKVRTLCNGDMCMKLDPSTSIIILDIPDQGGFYVLDGEFTKENISDFYEKFLKGELKDSRKQLQG